MESTLAKPGLPSLAGMGFVLRSPRPTDKLDRLSIGRHPDFVRMVGDDERFATSLSDEDVEQWYTRLCAEPFEWVIETSGGAIGTARLHRLEELNRRARFAIGIFDPAWWDRGVGTQPTRLVLGYAFEHLRLHRVDLRVLMDNQRAITTYEKCGFVCEGIERETLVAVDGWRSDLIMSILEDEYRLAVVNW